MAKDELTATGDDAYLKECEALVKYIGRYGDILASKPDTAAFDELACLVAKYRGGEETSEAWPKLVRAYANVTKITMAARGVNGRSVRDTLAAGDEQLAIRAFWFGRLATHRRPLRVALWLSISAMALQFVDGMASRVGDPEGELEALGLLYPYYLVKLLAPTLVPAVWGGLGACVFLMKQVSDRLAEFTYVEARLKGYGTRVLLGAIFGVVVVQWLFDVQASGRGMADTLGQAVAAFAAGLGTKAVYAAFEQTVEVIASRIKGTGMRNGGG